MIRKLKELFKKNAGYRIGIIILCTSVLLLLSDILLYLVDQFIGREKGVIFGYRLTSLIRISNLIVIITVTTTLVVPFILKWLKLNYILRLLKNLAISVVSIVVTLTVVEVIFYIALKVRNNKYKSAPYAVEQHDGFFRSDTLLGYALNKNINIKYRKAEVSNTNSDTLNIFDFIVQTDSLGNRIVDIPKMRDRKKYAIFFGCSFTFGLGLEDSVTVPHYFATFDSSYCTYNYAVPGYGPQNMLAQLEKINVRKSIKQDSGICFYVYMDSHPYRAIGNMTTYTTYAQDLPYYDYKEGKLIRYGSFRENRILTSAFYTIMSKSNFIKYFNINFPNKLTEQHYKLTCDIIYESYKKYKEQFNNDNFYVVIYPGEQGIVPHLKKYDLKIVDLSKALDQANIGLCFIPKDGHPTAYMNKILAKRLAIDVN